MTRSDVMLSLILISTMVIASGLLYFLLRPDPTFEAMADCPKSVVMVRTPKGDQIICAPVDLIEKNK
jgi:hypothetical protein